MIAKFLNFFSQIGLKKFFVGFSDLQDYEMTHAFFYDCNT